MNNPQSEAIRVMGEVIAAQALHIEKLEAGHWSKHTRKRVDRAKRELARLSTSGHGQASEAEAAVREAAYAERIAQLPTVEVPPLPRTILDVDSDVDETNLKYPDHAEVPHEIGGASIWRADDCERCRHLMPLWDERQSILYRRGRIPEDGMFKKGDQIGTSAGGCLCYTRHEVAPGVHQDVPHQRCAEPGDVCIQLSDGGGMIEDCNATRQAREALHRDTAEAGLDPKVNQYGPPRPTYDPDTDDQP